MLGFPAEAEIELQRSSVRDVGYPSGQGKARLRSWSTVVIAVVEVRVLADGERLRLGESNLLCCAVSADRNNSAPLNTLGEGHRPFKCPRPTHGTAKDGVP